MNLREKMTQDLVAVDSSATAEDVAKKMDEENVGTVLVMDQGKLNGLVTDRQIAIKAVAVGK
jgi:predicted transcriptional regulator